MSQNKTIVPGVDYDNTGNNEYDEAALDGLYTRSGNDDNRTYIADSPEPLPSDALTVRKPVMQAAATEMRDSRLITMQNRVIVGCLFSVSHGLLGEMFPLYLGRNIIGQAPGCDVRLKERTVSSEHAILYIRKEGNPVRYNMTITDYNSANGTEVNGVDGRYETLSVQENDVIQIGCHYKLLVKIFNVEEANMEEDEAFGDTDMTVVDGPVAGYSNQAPDIYMPSQNNKSRGGSRTVISDNYLK